MCTKKTAATVALCVRANCMHANGFFFHFSRARCSSLVGFCCFCRWTRPLKWAEGKKSRRTPFQLARSGKQPLPVHGNCGAGTHMKIDVMPHIQPLRDIIFSNNYSAACVRRPCTKHGLENKETHEKMAIYPFHKSQRVSVHMLQAIQFQPVVVASLAAFFTCNFLQVFFALSLSLFSALPTVYVAHRRV